MKERVILSPWVVSAKNRATILNKDLERNEVVLIHHLKYVMKITRDDRDEDKRKPESGFERRTQ